MSRRRPRNLSTEEKALWNKVTDSAIPIDPNRRETSKPVTFQTTKAKVKNQNPIAPFNLGQSSSVKPGHDLSPTLAESLGAGRVQMDAKAFTKMKRGKLEPEARIDLHGMTIARAHPALTRFILNAQSQGKRLVLVITGKGKSKSDTGPIPMKMGVLKHEVPQWLQQTPLRSAVLQISQASLKHGGSGAYYVYLRRLR